MTNPTMDSLKGHFLAAMPLLMDPNFRQTVTCICEHTASGAMGVVINRLIPDLVAGNIYRELEIRSDPEADGVAIHMGGPVHLNQIFILHGPPFGWRGTFMVTPDLALSNTLDLLTAIAKAEGPSNYLIALGSAGWGPGQLEMELRENAWLSAPIAPDIVFKSPLEDRWSATLRTMGIDPMGLSDTAGHA